MTSSWQPKTLNKSLFRTLSSDISDPILCAIASVRDYGIQNSQDFYAFIKNDLDHLNSPDIVPNIDKIVDIFTNPPQSAYVFGDYDVDGTFSSFMLKNILYSGGCKDISFYIPHRKTDGYGLNERSLQNFINDAKNKSIGLVVLLDCGTNSKKEIAILKKELGNPTIVIIDHHIVDEEKFASNADVIINNRLAKNVPPYSTGGLVYQVARKLKPHLKFHPDRLLPYAAMTTVADVSPLHGDNRIIVANGLKALPSVKNHGLVELMRVSGIGSEDCTVEDISFRLGPRINANGRIRHASRVIDLLNEKDEDKAFGMALEMNAVNEERKKLQNKMINSAITKIGEKYDGNCIVIYDDKWEIGIVGIVASKLTEKYGVPSLVFGNHEGAIKGSARSISGINIKEVMDMVPHLFEAYGGHEMAAGATLKEEYVKTAQSILEEAINTYKKQTSFEEIPIEYDLLIKPKTFYLIDNDFCENLQQFGPFGQENEKIVFRVDGIKCKSVHEWGSGVGAFVTFEGTKMDCFFYGSNAEEKLAGKTLDLLFEIGENFKDDEKWAIIIKDHSEPADETKNETKNKNETQEETKYYAGIGSRDTPEDILDLMKKIACHLNAKGYILRSGGANGADSAFEEGAKNDKQVFLPWPFFNGNASPYDGTNWKYRKVHLKLARKHHPSFDTLKTTVKKLMVRNSAQIIGKNSTDIPSSFVVCYTSDGRASGGTGQAIRLALSLGIKVYNLYDAEVRSKFEKMTS